MWSKADRSVLLASSAVLAVGLAGTWLVASPSGASPRPSGDDLVEVLVVRKDLPVNTLLDESALESHVGRGSVRRDRLPADAVRDKRLVLGQSALRNIRAGEYLSANDVGHPVTDPVPTYGQYSVRLGPEDHSADAFRPGDRVDLFVAVWVGGWRVGSEPVLKGLLVIAVDATDRVLAVGVTPTQARAIVAAESRGGLRAVRSAGAE